MLRREHTDARVGAHARTHTKKKKKKERERERERERKKLQNFNFHTLSVRFQVTSCKLCQLRSSVALSV